MISDVVAKMTREINKCLDLPFSGQPRKGQETVYFITHKLQVITIYRVADILYLGKPKHAYNVVIEKSSKHQLQVYDELSSFSAGTMPSSR